MSIPLKNADPTTHHLTHPKYRPDIDGLRALAVVLVVLFHAFPKMLPGGFVGVDIFFVISGYLISSIIFGNLEHDSFSYAEFYARRVRRIFPALALVLTCCIGVGWFILFIDEFKQLGLHIAGGAGSVANLVLWNESGYFDNDAYAKPLLHLWSLGIEEQFYILWPLLLGMVWKRKFNFLSITLLIALTSFAFNVLTVQSDSVTAFYAPWSRFWELMVGGILAYLTLHRPHYLSAQSNWRAGLGLLLILLSVGLLNKHSSFPGWWALLPTIGTFLLISAGNHSWLNRKLFSSRGMVGIGLISYPLYLWHWPLLSFPWISHGKMPPNGTRVVLVLISFLLAYLTYRLIEKPARAGGTKAVISLTAILLTLLLAGLGLHSGSVRPRNDNPEIQPIMEALYDWEFPQGFEKTSFKGIKVYSKKAGSKNTLFIGDSHMDQYGPRIAKLLDSHPEKYHSAIFLTSAGCAPLPGSAQSNEHRLEKCNNARRETAKMVADPEISTVVMGAAWNLYYVKSSRKYTEGMHLETELNTLEQFIHSIAKRKKVYFLLDNPNGAIFEPRHYFSGSRIKTLKVNTVQKQVDLAEDQREMSMRLAQLASRAGAEVIDPIAYLCRKQCPALTIDGKPVYKDDNHYRPFFVRENAGFIDVTLE